MKSGLLAGACLCALFLSVSVSVSVSVSAQQATPRPLVGGHGDNVDAFIAQHDGNADGRLTWDEFDAFRRQRFDATDTNGDGTIDVAEYVEEFGDRMRRQSEQGRDGQIEQTQRRFSAIDADKNGRIAPAEFDASGERVWTEGQKALASREPNAKGSEEKTDAALRSDRNRNRSALPSSHSAEGFLELFDGNGDGQVNRAEFDQARQAQFARTDTNGDGKLSQDEYLAEYKDRLDRHVVTLVSGSERQTRVRFGALDTDKDGKMTFAEYQVSGRRTFEATDRNHDGVVDRTDVGLPPQRRDGPTAGADAAN